MAYLKANPGSAISARNWNQIVDRLPADSLGQGVGGLPVSQTAVLSLNSSGANREIGDLLVTSSFDGPTATIYDAIDNAAFSVQSPAWHTSIDSIAVCGESTPTSERGLAIIAGVCLVKLDAAPASGHTHVFVDPTTPNRCKPSYSGFAKILAAITVGADNYAFVSLGDHQNWWRYELTQASQAPSTTTAKLLDLTDTQYAASINLKDPDSLMSDQTTGDKGYCVNIGNDFYAMQATCPP